MIKNGDKVSVNYTGKFEDGTVFDTSEGRTPIEFNVGLNEVISGFENAVVGLSKGERTTVELEADQAYGQVMEELISKVPRASVPEDCQVGAQLQGVSTNGEPFSVVVTEIDENMATVDANHPLAGRKLIFDIEVVDVA